MGDDGHPKHRTTSHPNIEGTDMAELPRPTAARLRQPSWRDTRLVVGVVLVLLSMAIGAKVLSLIHI